MKVKNSGNAEIETLLQDLKPVPPRDPSRAARGKAEFLDQASELREAVSAGRIVRHRKWNFIPRKEKFAMNVFVSLLLALALLAGGGATAAAAQDDLPTDPLYPVKLFTEDARLMLNGDPLGEIEMLMEMSTERVREMIALSEAGIDPPNQVALRFEQQIRQALQIASSLEDENLDEALAGIQESLQTQEQLMTQAQNQAGGESVQFMNQVQSLLQLRLRMVDEGLADPQGFRHTTQNERTIGQGEDELVPPYPNQQGEPAYQQNEQPPQGNGNQPNGNGPKNVDETTDLEIIPTPTILQGQGPGPGGKGQGGNN